MDDRHIILRKDLICGQYSW